MNYQINYLYTNDTEGLSLADKAKLFPSVGRIRASNATRAISAFINEQKNAGKISGKADIVILEAKVVA